MTGGSWPLALREDSFLCHHAPYHEGFLRVFIITFHRSRLEMINFHPALRKKKIVFLLISLRKLRYVGFKLFLSPEMGNKGRILS